METSLIYLSGISHTNTLELLLHLNHLIPCRSPHTLSLSTSIPTRVIFRTFTPSILSVIPHLTCRTRQFYISVSFLRVVEMYIDYTHIDDKKEELFGDGLLLS